VVTAWRVEQAGYRLLDVYRRRATFPELKRDIALLDARWRPDALLVEDIGSGKEPGPGARAETRLPVDPLAADRDKAARANAVTQLFACGSGAVPKDAPWLRTYINELLQFPAGAHDDQVDSTTMASPGRATSIPGGARRRSARSRSV
jgi:predicted phage terminase large subunit-like protein